MASRGRLHMDISKLSASIGGKGLASSSKLSASMKSMPTLSSIEARREEIQREYSTLRPLSVIARRQEVLDEWDALDHETQKMSQSGPEVVGYADPAEPIDEDVGRLRRFRSMRKRAPRLADKVTSPYRTLTRDVSSEVPLKAEGLPPWLAKDRQVLRFKVYFREAVSESATETHRVHRCVLYFFLADGTMRIGEPQRDCSGIPQGEFLKRGKYENKAAGSSFEPDHFVVGDTFEVCGRVFGTVDCDEFTRAYCHKFFGLEQPPAEPYPGDPHMDLHATTQLESTQPTRSRKTDNGAIARGRPSLHPKRETLAQYKKFDRNVLRFDALWDDTKRHAGQERCYTVNYFLGDDTIEVREVYEKNSGRDPFPYLLKRQRLPRDWKDTATPDLVHGRQPEKYIVENDLVCGSFLDVFGRPLLLVGCDKYTSEFYERRGVHQEPVETFREVKALVKPTLPAYNGYGTDADSMANCVNLVPKRTKTDLRLFLRFQGMVLRYKAKMVDCAHEADKNREFLVSYFLEDDTVSIYEPPIRNSGVVGGRYLERKKYRIVMGPKTAAELPHERITLEEMLYDRIMQRLSSGGSGLMRAFKYFGKCGGGGIDLPAFSYGCDMVGLLVSDAEKKQLFDLFDEDGSGHLDFSEFIEHVLGDSHGHFGADAAAFHSRNLRASDFLVGKTFQLLFVENGQMAQPFRITHCDQYTAKLIERYPELFPKSNVQAIVNLMPARLSELGIKVKQAFNELDHTGRGYITLEQFRRRIADWAVDLGFVGKTGLPEEELDQLVRHYNDNNDDKIEINEFCEAFSAVKEFQEIHQKRVQSVEGKIFDLLTSQATGGCRATFRAMDRDGNGKVTFKEFKNFLAEQGYLLNEREKAYIMLKYDRDGDGCIEYDEFARRGARGAADEIELNAEQKKRLDAGISGYLDILSIAEGKPDTGDLMKDFASAFSAAFKTRRRLLRKNFLRFDGKRQGLVGENHFIEALDTTNADFTKSTLGAKMLEMLFKDDLELRKINFDHFMDVMFAQNLDAIQALFAM